VSGQTFNGNDKLLTDAPSVASLAEVIRKASISTSVRSPFVATTGLADTFSSVGDLLSIRDGIWMQSALVPLVATEDSRGMKLPINAYIVDFLRHGRFYVLQKDNHLPTNQIYALLQSWQALLTIMNGFLSNLQNENWEVHGARYDLKVAFKKLATEFEAAMRGVRLQTAITGSLAD